MILSFRIAQFRNELAAMIPATCNAQLGQGEKTVSFAINRRQKLTRPDMRQRPASWRWGGSMRPYGG
jgi:hypothetical protein